ncbi:ABC transporter permease [Rhabdothermincola salaria]|uniref:ABC transporter permease n=1 Tax=Rhabdothermincola salaria TaxID=2903142 RepID=UPI001E38D486|nr:ABC transporter permease [Rhabdothermincola salaria]
MQEFLQYTILGLVIGGVYGIAASGLVVTYTTSGIFNFAHGAIAMLGAFSYWQVRWGWGWPAPLALIAVLGILAPAVGALLYQAVMKNLRGTSEVTKIIVPVGVMLGFLALATWIWNPTPRTPRLFQKFFGQNAQVSIFGVNVTWHEIIALLLAVAIAFGIRFLFHSTRSGVAMRAVVDDPDLLQLNGGRPERLATISWAGGAFLAALAGILITPIQGSAMSANALTLLVIDAFAAAMFGRLRSLPRTFVGAIILGLLGNYVIAYFPAAQWTWTGAFRSSIPMILLFIILLLLPQDRLRGATVLRTRERFIMPSLRTAWIGGLVLVGVVFAMQAVMAQTAVNTVAFGMTFALVALSLVLLTGYAGEINLAALSFGAIGTIIVFHYGISGGTGPTGRTTLWGFVLAGVVCAVVGAIVALPALRLRGLYLALATMAFGVFVSRMVLTEIGQRELFGVEFSIFQGGSLTIPRPEFFGLDFNDNGAFLMLVTVLFALLGVGLIALRKSGYGRRLSAMKDSPAACATLGMSVVRLKLSVFMMSAAIAGIGGALMSAQLGSVNLDRFDIFLSLALLLLTVVGGIGYVSAALFSGLLNGAAFLSMQNSLEKLGSDYRTLQPIFGFLVSAVTVLPATIGVTMGKNPSGAITDIAEGLNEIKRSKVLMLSVIALQALVWGLWWQDVYNGWWFTIFTALNLLLVPPIGGAIVKAFAVRKYDLPQPTPPELIGLDVPFTDDDRQQMDHVLALDSVPVPVGTHVHEGETVHASA